MSGWVKKCKRPCKFRSSTPRLNGCDYLYLTRERRGCPAGEECTRFVEGDRMKDPGDPTKMALLVSERQEEVVRYTNSRIYKALDIRTKTKNHM